jgi:hypothetical protein
MANEDIQETIAHKRIESVASRESSFYTLSNRLIMPLLFISLVTFFPISFWPAAVTIMVIFIEFVIRYIFKTTMKDIFRSAWRKIFGSKRKGIRN